MVAVQIQTLGVGPLAHPPRGAVLSGPVIQPHRVVSVRVVDRSDEQDHVVEPAVVLPRGDFPQKDLKGFLPLYLAPMDVSLEVEDQFPTFSDRRRASVGQSLGNGHEGNRSGLVREPERRERHSIVHSDHGFEEFDHLGVTAGLEIVRAFGTCKEVGRPARDPEFVPRFAPGEGEGDK